MIEPAREPVPDGYAGPSPPRLADREFRRFQELIHREAGIYLAPSKGALLVGRLARRLRELGLRSFAEYYGRVVADGDELRHLLDLISTNETRFFREPRHFEFLERVAVPRWRDEAVRGRRAARLRIWSAGCASGEEPYSLAMLLLDQLPAKAGWTIEILATDLSTRALKKARAAVWPADRTRDIPPCHRTTGLLRGVGPRSGLIKVAPEVRAVVQFRRLNLNDETYPWVGRFDAVFCRNVLIYFSAETRARAVGRILDQLHPGGYLFLGHAESLNRVTDRVSRVIPTVYVHAGGARP